MIVASRTVAKETGCFGLYLIKGTAVATIGKPSKYCAAASPLRVAAGLYWSYRVTPVTINPRDFTDEAASDMPDRAESDKEEAVSRTGETAGKADLTSV